PAIPDPLRPTPKPDQRTLNPEEPANCPEKPRNYGSLRLLARLTLEELQRAFDELEDHPVRGTQERDVEPVDLAAGQRAPHRVAAPLDPVGHGGQGLLDVLDAQRAAVQPLAVTAPRHRPLTGGVRMAHHCHRELLAVLRQREA